MRLSRIYLQRDYSVYPEHSQTLKVKVSEVIVKGNSFST